VSASLDLNRALTIRPHKRNNIDCTKLNTICRPKGGRVSIPTAAIPQSQRMPTAPSNNSDINSKTEDVTKLELFVIGEKD
jgi:hypothetical protein